MCKHINDQCRCKGTGIVIVKLDDTQDMGIQACDYCRRLTDKEATKKIELLLKQLEYVTEGDL